MSGFLLTRCAREDVETLVRRLARAQPRAARRALDELFASMEWLAGEGAGAPLDGVAGACIRPLRDVLLAYRPADEKAGTPAVLLRVLCRDPRPKAGPEAGPEPRPEPAD